MVCCHYYRPTLFKRPPETPLPDPLKDCHFYGEVHISYPLTADVQQYHFPSLFFHTAKFHIILNDLANDLFGGAKRKTLSLKEATEYYGHFMTWFRTLPAALNPSNIVLPSHLQLQ